MLTHSQEKANLARLRDNQRRSRARRKEYLQELEARLRQCELQGVEASSEIQTAARRVADENKKLRALLAQRGVQDDSIEAYLQKSAPTPAMGMGTGMGGGQYGSQSATVQVLEQLLSARRPCCVEGTEPMAAPFDRDSLGGSVTATQSHWDPAFAQGTSGRRSGTQQSRKILSPQQLMTPSASTTSRTSTNSLGHDPTPGGSRYQIPRNLSPASNPSSHSQKLFDYDDFLSSDQVYPQIQEPKQLPYQPTQPGPPIYIQKTESPNVNSCNYAAEMITTMAGTTDHSAVRAELGCVGGMDCEVDSQLVFNVMDRYSGIGL
ncbi:uncharacterized protein L3040_004961 [Drepanopeziza brunnea f. sp. 'multigermtubi']|uniref:BZIP domain-containing protein n=1 Tax=Marssonina brunnea f. sp. multigermtubi (strain MB_m1) TaxID=1072389 RepID=K1Y9A9_MARBU|nr:uncharacterized protein MBM_00852 [Drepanopeziza brunnea f. sp. 'multigermtubi' MB_m1]EKD21739.1 hypothetical protein MBM_00852 [Drepanopeziza brunnea f. sp. 'multigermtubi' MB_m1]KAJ5042412.1 hypothetical protein L3040_004961 [Drepanopeziza brunnea f. sp. 'multigermtubi']